jgi:hypothetical protein
VEDDAIPVGSSDRKVVFVDAQMSLSQSRRRLQTRLSSSLSMNTLQTYNSGSQANDISGPFTLVFETNNPPSPFYFLEVVVVPDHNRRVQSRLSYQLCNEESPVDVACTRILTHYHLECINTNPPQRFKLPRDLPQWAVFDFILDSQPVLHLTVCKTTRTNAFNVITPPNPQRVGPTARLQDGVRAILNSEVEVLAVGIMYTCQNCTVFAARERCTGQIFELWCPTVWA